MEVKMEESGRFVWKVDRWWDGNRMFNEERLLVVSDEQLGGAHRTVYLENKVEVEEYEGGVCDDRWLSLVLVSFAQIQGRDQLISLGRCEIACVLLAHDARWDHLTKQHLSNHAAQRRQEGHVNKGMSDWGALLCQTVIKP